MHSTRSKPSRWARWTPRVTAADWPVSVASRTISAPCAAVLVATRSSPVTTIVRSIEGVCDSASSTSATIARASSKRSSSATLAPSRCLARAKRLTGRTAAVRMPDDDTAVGLAYEGIGEIERLLSDPRAARLVVHAGVGLKGRQAADVFIGHDPVDDLAVEVGHPV